MISVIKSSLLPGDGHWWLSRAKDSFGLRMMQVDTGKPLLVFLWNAPFNLFRFIVIFSQVSLLHHFSIFNLMDIYFSHWGMQLARWNHNFISDWTHAPTFRAPTIGYLIWKLWLSLGALTTYNSIDIAKRANVTEVDLCETEYTFKTSASHDHQELFLCDLLGLTCMPVLPIPYIKKTGEHF